MRRKKPKPYMDPDANLKEVRRLVRVIMLAIDSSEFRQDPKMLVDYVHDAALLADCVDALDVWIVAGGPLPREWK